MGETTKTTENTTIGRMADTLTSWGRERAKKCVTQKAVSDAHAEYTSVSGQMRPGEHVDAAYKAWVDAGNANLRQYDRVAALYSELLCAIADEARVAELEAAILTARRDALKEAAECAFMVANNGSHVRERILELVDA